MIDYQIAIPSYKRYETIKEKTLQLLSSHNINPDRVTIFVADEDEAVLYEKALNGNKYANNIVVGVPTIGQQRNFIERYYPEGTNLMMFDDDIVQVQKKQGDKLIPINDLEKEIIFNGFANCHKHGSKIFGIYAASNAFFMKERVYTNLCYIIASMFGLIVEHDDYLKRITNHGEDYEYSLRHYVKNGVLCRLDNYTVKSNYYGEEGGLQEIRTKKYVENSIMKIYMNFPQLCTMYTRKTTGFAELRFHDNEKQEYRKKHLAWVKSRA